MRPETIRLNRVPQWCVTYSFRDNGGCGREGASHLISSEEGSLWKEGDTRPVRFDEKSPSISIWMGQT